MGLCTAAAPGPPSPVPLPVLQPRPFALGSLLLEQHPRSQPPWQGRAARLGLALCFWSVAPELLPAPPEPGPSPGVPSSRLIRWPGTAQPSLQICLTGSLAGSLPLTRPSCVGAARLRPAGRGQRHGRAGAGAREAQARARHAEAPLQRHTRRATSRRVCMCNHACVRTDALTGM